MTTKHPHHEVITAYLEGHQIEARYSGTKNWISIKPLVDNNWILPTFSINVEYRIQKEPIPDREYVMIIEEQVRGVHPRMRRPEHWESGNIRLLIDGSTQQLKAVEVI